jgi:hypothetical protein
VQGNPALVNSTFADSNYFANNFNDFGAAMMTLFALLIVNNWFVIMNTVCGCGAIFEDDFAKTGSGQAERKLRKSPTTFRITQVRHHGRRGCGVRLAGVASVLSCVLSYRCRCHLQPRHCVRP